MRYIFLILLSILTVSANSQTTMQKVWTDLNSSYQGLQDDASIQERTAVILHGWNGPNEKLETYLDSNKHLLERLPILLAASRDTLFDRAIVVEEDKVHVTHDRRFVAEYTALIALSAQKQLYDKKSALAVETGINLLELAKAYDEGPGLIEHVTALAIYDRAAFVLQAALKDEQGKSVLKANQERIKTLSLSDTLFMEQLEHEKKVFRKGFEFFYAYDATYQQCLKKEDNCKQYVHNTKRMLDIYEKVEEKFFGLIRSAVIGHDQDALAQIQTEQNVWEKFIKEDKSFQDFLSKKLPFKSLLIEDRYTDDFSPELLVYVFLDAGITHALDDIIINHQKLVKEHQSLLDALSK